MDGRDNGAWIGADWGAIQAVGHRDPQNLIVTERLLGYGLCTFSLQRHEACTQSRRGQ